MEARDARLLIRGTLAVTIGSNENAADTELSVSRATLIVRSQFIGLTNVSILTYFPPNLYSGVMPISLFILSRF